MSDWNAAVYLQFERERTRPAMDLAARVPLESPGVIVDLGCGPGNSTEVLRRRWPGASITGVDTSPEMIRKATATDASVTWVVGDAAEYRPATAPDLIYSNAMLHWLHDHAAVCGRWFGQLAPGGVLALQVPAHYDSALHREIVAVSRQADWDGRMESARKAMEHHPPDFYYDTLAALGAARVDVWETIYHQVVEGPEAIVQWFRGTGLRPYLDAIVSDEERARFEEMLLGRYRSVYERRGDGRVLFPFKRLFVVAERG